MSAAVFNRIGQDSVECELVQFGTHIAESQLEHKLLDGDLTYHFAITELSVPLNKVPMHPVTVDTPIITLRRRNPTTPYDITDYVNYAEYLAFVGSTVDQMGLFRTAHAAALIANGGPAVVVQDTNEQIYIKYITVLSRSVCSCK